LRRSGVRIFGPNASAAQDLEPEFIAVSADGRRAWATLQENNALAIIDVVGARVEQVVALGYRDHKRGRPRLRCQRSRPAGQHPPMARPRECTSRTPSPPTPRRGRPTWSPPMRETRATTPPTRKKSRSGRSSTRRSSPARAAAGSCAGDANLARLMVTKAMGMNAATGQWHTLYAFGTRSFSIWSADGRQLWDSGEELERRTSALPMVQFNAGSTGTRSTIGATTRDRSPKGSSSAGWGARPSPSSALRARGRDHGLRRHPSHRTAVRHLRQHPRRCGRRPGTRGDPLRPGGPIA
jgi:hypothetical protein